MKTKVTGHLKAWTTNAWDNYDRVQEHADKGENDEVVNLLSFSMCDMSHVTNWTEVGVATITVEFYPREQVVAKQIEGLSEQLRQHRIKAHEAEQAILSQISKLTAIDNQPTA